MAWKHTGSEMDLRHGRGGYPCEETYEDELTGMVVSARSTREAHAAMPGEVEDIAEVLGLPGVEPRSTRIVRAGDPLITSLPLDAQRRLAALASADPEECRRIRAILRTMKPEKLTGALGELLPASSAADPQRDAGGPSAAAAPAPPRA